MPEELSHGRASPSHEALQKLYQVLSDNWRKIPSCFRWGEKKVSILKYVKSIKFLLMCAFQRSYFMRNSNLRDRKQPSSQESGRPGKPRHGSSPGSQALRGWDQSQSTTLLFTAAPLPRTACPLSKWKLQAYQRAEIQFEEQAKNGRAGTDVGIIRPGI